MILTVVPSLLLLLLVVVVVVVVDDDDDDDIDDDGVKHDCDWLIGQPRTPRTTTPPPPVPIKTRRIVASKTNQNRVPNLNFAATATATVTGASSRTSAPSLSSSAASREPVRRRPPSTSCRTCRTGAAPWRRSGGSRCQTLTRQSGGVGLRVGG